MCLCGDGKKIFLSFSYHPVSPTHTHTHLYTHASSSTSVWLRRNVICLGVEKQQEEIDMYRITYFRGEKLHTKAQNRDKINPKEMFFERQGQRQWKGQFNQRKEKKAISVFQSISPESYNNIWQELVWDIELAGSTFYSCVFSEPKAELRCSSDSCTSSSLPPIPLSDKLPTSLWNMTHKARCHYKPGAMADLWIQLPPCL